MKLRCLNNFILDYPFSSKIALKILPQVIVTSFKFTNWTPVHRLKGEKFEKETKLINSLKNQCKEVPTIIASKFTNACYIKGLDDLAKNDEWDEIDYENFCNEFGININEFKSKLGPHIIIIGKQFNTAVIIAHEFGHYLNTIGKEGKLGELSHKYYDLGSRAGIYNLNSIKDSTKYLNELYLALMSKNEFLIKSAKKKFLLIGLIQLSNFALSRPVIIAEATASKTALKNLKLFGATDNELKTYARQLLVCFSTYSVVNSILPGLVMQCNIIIGLS